MSRFRKPILIVVFVVIVLAGASTLFWRSPDYYLDYESVEFPAPFLTDEEYDDLIDSHLRPYILEYYPMDRGAVLLYGSEHTKDPADYQVGDIEMRFSQFNPSVVLVESRLGFFIQGIQHPVKAYGEMGWAFALARKNRIPVYTWEIPRQREIEFVRVEFPQEQVALYYILRPYFSKLRFGKPDDPDAAVEKTIRERGDDPGIAGAISSVAAIDAIWRRDFPDQPDWRDTSDQFGLPGYLSAVAARANRARDEHLAQVIVNLSAQGERVFAIAGLSHAVKLEPVLDGVFAFK
jgi:hypothetical protein